MEETQVQSMSQLWVYYYSVKKSFPVVVFGLVLSILFVSFVALRSLMELFEDSESLWDSDLEFEE